MIIQPKVRGFICVTAHPAGCAAHVQEQIDHVKSGGPLAGGPKKVLIVGASTGYGLSSRIAAAFGSGAATLGVFFEKPSSEDKLGTAGWYNTAAFTAKAREAGLYARNINGDAYSDAIKEETIQAIREDLGQVDLVIYSLASPRRTHPVTGNVHSSVLKPVGQNYTNKTVDTVKGIVSEITLEPASAHEIEETIAVMGGEDWERWISALDGAGVLAPGATTAAYTYVGPELTWPIYRDGTIGHAKNDLERAGRAIGKRLAPGGGRAFISVNKALVTQASSAIPVVPLYISILNRLLKANGHHEGCIEQIDRLYRSHLYSGTPPVTDASGRIRIDDYEMAPDVQAQVAEIWPQVTTENLEEITDIAGYRTEFLRLFGFGLPGVDYEAESDPHVEIS